MCQSSFTKKHDSYNPLDTEPEFNGQDIQKTPWTSSERLI